MSGSRIYLLRLLGTFISITRWPQKRDHWPEQLQEVNWTLDYGSTLNPGMGHWDWYSTFSCLVMSTITPVDLRKPKENFAFYFISINILYTPFVYVIQLLWASRLFLIGNIASSSTVNTIREGIISFQPEGWGRKYTFLEPASSARYSWLEASNASDFPSCYQAVDVIGAFIRVDRLQIAECLKWNSQNWKRRNR